MSEGEVIDTIRAMCKDAKEQIELLRIMAKESSVKISQLEQVILELEHYADEHFTGGWVMASED